MTRGVFIKGNFEEGNFGDDCLLAASLLLLRRRGFETWILGAPTRTADADFRVASADISNLRSGGLVLYGGGTQFFSDPNMPFDVAPIPMRLRISRVIHDPRRLLASLKARATHVLLARRKTAAIGLGVGPFGPEAAADEANVAALLRQTEFVWVRDPASAAFCQRHGVAHVESADLCYTSPFLARFGSGSAFERPKGGPKIGVILSDHTSLDTTFLAAMRQAANQLRAEGIEVRFVSLSKRADRFPVALRAAGEPIFAWDPEADTIGAFRIFLAAHDAIVTARFHGGVFSVINQTPFAVIGVNDKLRTLPERYAAVGIPLLATTDPASSFANVMRHLLDGSDQRRGALARALAAEIETARRGEDAFDTFLDAMPSSTRDQPDQLNRVTRPLDKAHAEDAGKH